MPLFLLTALAMTAFAANSVLTRMALVQDTIDPVTFGTIRLLSGAAVLWVFVAFRGDTLRGAADWRASAALFLYMFGFSFAYLALDAGVGALVLFGMVQITMFAGGLRGGERPPAHRWTGAAIAFAGLAWLMWPGGGAMVNLLHATFMILAGVGWGIYSLLGRGTSDPLRATAANFALATPGGVVLACVWLATAGGSLSAAGVLLACLSGAVTSGLGYALWYRVLPQLQPSVAAVAQLTVPVIAMVGGLALLAEPVTPTIVLASVIVLGGVLISLLPRQS